MMPAVPPTTAVATPVMVGLEAFFNVVIGLLAEEHTLEPSPFFAIT